MNFNDMLVEHFHTLRPQMIKMLSRKTEYAEDILQEAYYRALKYQASYDTSRSFNVWINKIIHSCTMDFLREEKGYLSVNEDEAEEEAIDCPSYPSHIVREIYELINTKSVAQIDVLTLYFKHEYSAMDISHITEYSYAMSHKIISRFREELRQLYKE